MNRKHKIIQYAKKIKESIKKTGQSEDSRNIYKDR